MQLSTRREFIVDNAVFAGAAIGLITIGTAFPAAGAAQAGDSPFHESSCTSPKLSGPKILVTYASRCGSTGGTAEAIGATFCKTGAAVDIQLVKNITDIDGYQAVVIGSAVRGGKWLPEAADFVKTHRKALIQLPVAYFVSCLAMCRPSTENRATALSYLDTVREAVPEINPVGIGLFAGVLDYRKLSFMMGLIMKSKMNDKGISEGDYRDWNAIRQWADEVYPRLVGNSKKIAVHGGTRHR